MAAASMPMGYGSRRCPKTEKSSPVRQHVLRARSQAVRLLNADGSPFSASETASGSALAGLPLETGCAQKLSDRDFRPSPRALGPYGNELDAAGLGPWRRFS